MAEPASDSRTRILEEVYRLHSEIANCAHCAALRGQIVRLMDLVPPDPIHMRREELIAFLKAMADEQASKILASKLSPLPDTHAR